jgi:hypothetical protein
MMIAAVVIGIVAECEFALAQAAIGELAGYGDYEDWLDARWGPSIRPGVGGSRRHDGRRRPRRVPEMALADGEAR